MNSSDSSSTDPWHDPERLLGAGLRATTPGFEARFDALLGDLAAHPARGGWRAWFTAWGGRRTLWAAAGVGAAAALVLVTTRPRPAATPSAVDLDAYADVFALEEALRPALPLTDADTLNAVLVMPLHQEDHS